MLVSPLFPVLADSFQCADPYWLDDKNYPLNEVMTAVCARLVNRKVVVVNYVEQLNLVWDAIIKMEKCETIHHVVGGCQMVIYKQDSGIYYELVMYSVY